MVDSPARRRELPSLDSTKGLPFDCFQPHFDRSTLGPRKSETCACVTLTGEISGVTQACRKVVLRPFAELEPIPTATRVACPTALGLPTTDTIVTIHCFDPVPASRTLTQTGSRRQNPGFWSRPTASHL